ncbi:MAG: trypsin-like peptidase domain-containing protein [Oscillospiraceae bacterium]|nr:trypsin-like peptidase domain-containing protein [Oscillospiraceae bacterium]
MNDNNELLKDGATSESSDINGQNNMCSESSDVSGVGGNAEMSSPAAENSSAQFPSGYAQPDMQSVQVQQTQQQNNMFAYNSNATYQGNNQNTFFGDLPQERYNMYGEWVAEPKKESRKTGIFAAIMLVLIFIMISVLTVYCIFTDLQQGSLAFNERAGGSSVSLMQQSKPEDNDSAEYVDENGRYTPEGLAEYIRPQIVEIYAYNSKFPEAVIGTGSGIIITTDGYIVTNTHVLDSYTMGLGKDIVEADSYVVSTSDGKKYEAMIAGRDTKTDIAVIKIEAQNLPCATLGNSDETVLGEQVVAIGNPAGLTGSITEGIVSGLDRKIKAESTGFEMNCIQTDAAISPGNSGGALINMYGQVIGITSSKYVEASYEGIAYEGLGFAITINEAKPIIEELITNGYISGRFKIGITFYSMDNEMILAEFREKYDRDIPDKLKGLWITEISEDCDIANTELKSGDFILSVNGKDVQTYDDLNAVLDGKKAGDKLSAECARIEEDMTISYFDIEFRLMEDTSGDY